MGEFEHKFVNTNGIRMHLHEAGTGFPVVMCHGFPEIWYSWRHQIRALAASGFRAIAPDQRGYGETESPPQIEAYTQKQIVADVVGMLDALGIDKCVIVGHDWGGMVAWNTSWRLRPGGTPEQFTKAFVVVEQQGQRGGMGEATGNPFGGP